MPTYVTKPGLVLPADKWNNYISPSLTRHIHLRQHFRRGLHEQGH